MKFESLGYIQQWGWCGDLLSPWKFCWRGTVGFWQGHPVILCCPEKKDGAWLFSPHLYSGTYTWVLIPNQNLEFWDWKAEFWIIQVCAVVHGWVEPALECFLLAAWTRMYFTHSCWYQILGCFSGFCHLFETRVSAAFQGWANLPQRPVHHLLHFRTANNTLLSILWRFMLVFSGANRAAFHPGLVFSWIKQI